MSEVTSKAFNSIICNYDLALSPLKRDSIQMMYNTVFWVVTQYNHAVTNSTDVSDK